MKLHSDKQVAFVVEEVVERVDALVVLVAQLEELMVVNVAEVDVVQVLVCGYLLRYQSVVVVVVQGWQH